MTLVKSLLERHEDKTLEFKRDLSSPKSILKTLAAFANTAGGMLVIGIIDDKKVVGVEDPLGIEEKLTSLIADHITPFLLPTIKIVNQKKKSLVVVEVPFLANMGPFYLKQLGKEKGVMVRLGSSTRAATPEMIQELTRIHHAQGFDALPCPQASYDDLDYDLLKETFAKAEQSITKSKLKTLKILVPYGKDYVPSNAGVILFAKESVREQLFPMAYVSCARFAGIQKVDFLDRLDIGRVIEAVNAVPAFIRRNTKMGAIIKDIKREDVPEYPTVAVREGLLNALMHADYSYMNMRIFISIFDDRLEIRSPGTLPPGMTIDGIKEGVSMPRNLVIARIFQKLGWVEQFGTGYLRITNACEKHNYPLPEWKEVGPYTDIVFRPLEMAAIHNLPTGDDVSTKSAPSRHQVSTKSAPSQEELELLKSCYEAKPITELMKILDWKDRTKFRNRFITPLLEQGLLTMTIPDKPNSRLQQYVITEQGEKLLKQDLKR